MRFDTLPPVKEIVLLLLGLGVLFVAPLLAAISCGHNIRSGIRQAEKDIQAGAVFSETGKVILTGNGINYVVIIGNRTLKVSLAASLYLKHLDTYTLYYAPRSRIVLSAEPMA